MKKFSRVFIMFVLISILFITSVFATSVNEYKEIDNQDESINDDIMLVLSEESNDNIIDNDLFVTEENISIEKNVYGNLYLIGETINIFSEYINGNIFVIGKNVTINSDINGSVYIIAEKVSISGVMQNVYAISDEITIAEDAECTDVKTINGTLNIEGNVLRDVYTISDIVNISNNDYATVLGTLFASGEIVGNIDRINSIGIIEIPDLGVYSDSIENAIKIFFFISTETTALFIIILIVAFSSQKTFGKNDFKENMLKDILFGYLYYILTILLILLLLLTLIGIPAAMLLAVVVWFMFWKINLTVVAIEISSALLDTIKKSDSKKTTSKFLTIIVAFIIFTLVMCICHIENIGPIIKNIISVYGFGIIIRKLTNRNKKNEDIVEVL